MTVICLRLGTMRIDERAAIGENERFRRTILSHKDATDLFSKALRADIGYGIYYGVSDNPDRPWSIENAIRELGYHPTMNSQDIMSNPQEEADYEVR